MTRRLRLTAALAAPLALAACAAGDRGLVPVHQPLVAPTAASVPECPNWRDHLLPASEGQASNFGCATAKNLAAMIADPADLLHGKTGNGSGMAEVAVRAIKAMNIQSGSGAKGIDKTSAKAGG